MCIRKSVHFLCVSETGEKRNMTYRKKPSTSDPEIAEPDVFLKPGK